MKELEKLYESLYQAVRAFLKRKGTLGEIRRIVKEIEKLRS
jgi:hypothetical protein